MVITLTGFYLGLYTGLLADMPGKPLPHIGVKWEHAWGIVLILLPLVGPWYMKVWGFLLWALGIGVCLDDYLQHWHRVEDPSYRSPLHLWGWYVLRPWLAEYIWDGFNEV